MASERYRAFLSYSHKDRTWGDWLHRALETYRIDRDLIGRETPVGPIPKTLRPIFRDRDDFAGGPSLVEATLRALQESDFLVVICSPNSQRSHYVNEEVRLFKKLGRADRVIPVIVAGEPGDTERECFSPAVKFKVDADGQVTNIPAEPIAADVREEGDGREIAKQKIVAGLLGIGLDEIRKRAASAARRRHLLLSSVAILMTGLAVSATIAAWVARERTIEAEQRLDWALETAGAITTKASSFKAKFGVPVPVLSELLEEVDQLLGRLDQQGVKSSALKLREAKLLQALSDNNKDLGDTTKSLDEATRSLARLEAAKKQDGKTPVTDNDIGWANLKIGDLYKQRNDLGAAEERYTTSRQVFTSLTSSEPDKASWQLGLAAALGRLSDILTSEGKLNDAGSILDQDIAILRRVYSANPQDTFQASTLAIALANRASLSQRENENDKAISLLKDAEQIDETLVKLDPTNADWAATLALCKRQLGYATERAGNLINSITYYDQARVLFEKLSAGDPTNARKKDQLASILDNLGYNYQRTGQVRDAVEAFQKQVDIRKELFARDAVDGNQKSTLTVSLNRLAYAMYITGDSEGAWANTNESLQLTAELIKGDPLNLDLKLCRIISLGMVAVMANDKGDQNGATEAYEEMARLSNELATLDPVNSNKAYSAITASVFLANWYRQIGRANDTLAILDQARIRAELFHARSFSDPLWLGALSYVYEQIYLTKWNLDDVDGALSAARQYLEVSKIRSDRDQKNVEALQRTAGAYTCVGNALRRLGKLDDAYEAQSSALAIRRKLLDADPSDGSITADLAVSWARSADVLLEQKKFGQALEAYQQGLQTIQKAYQANEGSQYLKVTLGELYSGVGDSFQGLNRNSEAREAFLSSISIRKELVQRQPNNPDFRRDLDWSTRQLKALNQSAGVAASDSAKKESEQISPR